MRSLLRLIAVTLSFLTTHASADVLKTVDRARLDGMTFSLTALHAPNDNGANPAIPRDLSVFGPAIDVKTGQWARVFLIFEGRKPSDGKLVLYCKATLRSPDGEITGYPKTLCHDRPADSRSGGSSLTDFVFRILFEPDDPIGGYRVSVDVSNQKTGNSVGLAAGIRHVGGTT